MRIALVLLAAVETMSLHRVSWRVGLTFTVAYVLTAGVWWVARNTVPAFVRGVRVGRAIRKARERGDAAAGGAPPPKWIKGGASQSPARPGPETASRQKRAN